VKSVGSNGARRIPVPPGIGRRVDQALDVALDKALQVQRPAVLAYLDRARQRNPQMTPAELVRQLEHRYVAAAVGIGGASGAAAALPGAGTGASLASGAAEITGFVSATAMFVLALAELHELPLSDPEIRRALVVAVLVGGSADTVLEGGERGGSHWAQVLARRAGAKGSTDGPRGLDDRLRRLVLTRFGARQGALLLGRALPLGIGAGIGAAGNAALARAAVATARDAFGPPPQRFPPRVIDVPPAF
jgi:hypothetical protein